MVATPRITPPQHFNSYSQPHVRPPCLSNLSIFPPPVPFPVPLCPATLAFLFYEPGAQPHHLSLNPALPLALRDCPRTLPASPYLSLLSLSSYTCRDSSRPFMHVNAFVTPFKFPCYVRTITPRPMIGLYPHVGVYSHLSAHEESFHIPSLVPCSHS